MPGQDAVEGSPPPDGVVGLGARAVQTDLQVDRGHLEQTVDESVVEQRAVGAHAGGDAVLVRVAEDLEEIVPKERLPATEVHLKDLHPRQLVDAVLGIGRDRARRASARAARPTGSGRSGGCRPR